MLLLCKHYTSEIKLYGCQNQQIGLVESMVLPNKQCIFSNSSGCSFDRPYLCSPGVEIIEIQIGTNIDVIHGIKH